ncbi:MBL fold metallo-hydrolase [Candidatus Woesearchaeota archaeon]|nr:MBL fold metallo-hydrolase [Candidatus Woesearchaeota archaeon]
MVPRIIFLGTAGDHQVVSKQYRASGGIVLQVDDNQFHIDPGPGALVRAVENNVNLRANTCVLVSRRTVAHSNDVNAVISAMTLDGLDKKGVLISNKTFVQGDEDINPGLSNFHRNCVEKIIVLESGKRVGIENVEIVALPAEHLDANSIGFKFYTPYFVLSYSSDTKFSNDLLKAYEDSDILILHVTSPGDESGDNLSVADAIKIVNKIKPRLVITTHFGIKMLKADPIIQAREIQRQTGVQTIAAKDGMVISPGTYSAHSRQKTLLDVDKYKKGNEIAVDISDKR